jgi:hypothetical protein
MKELKLLINLTLQPNPPNDQLEIDSKSILEFINQPQTIQFLIQLISTSNYSISTASSIYLSKCLNKTWSLVTLCDSQLIKNSLIELLFQTSNISLFKHIVYSLRPIFKK